MKLVAFGTLLLLGLLAADGAAPGLEAAGEAAAVECETYWIGEELYVNACDALCAVGQRLLQAECLE